jgi:hypothetical protein
VVSQCLAIRVLYTWWWHFGGDACDFRGQKFPSFTSVCLGTVTLLTINWTVRHSISERSA